MERSLWMLVGVLSCGGKPAPPQVAMPAPVETIDPVTTGITSLELQDVVRRYWEDKMQREPTWASDLGDHRYDTQVENLSKEARTDWKARLIAFESEVGALEHLNPADTLTARLMKAEIRALLLKKSCGFDEWQFSARDNPMVALGNTADLTTLTNREEALAWIQRVEGFTGQLSVDASNRALGAAAGTAPTQHSVELVLAQLRPLTTATVDETPMLKPLLTLPEDTAEREALMNSARKAARLYQEGLSTWLTRIEDTVLPVARTEEQPPGLVGIPGGEACYAAMIEHHTSLPLTSHEVHQTGLDEIARLHQEVAVLGKKHADRSDVQEIFQWLRTDPSLYFKNADEIEAKAKEALARAKAKIPEYFSVLPETDCGVDRIPDYLAPYTTIAYYQPPAVGERPGTYYVNTYEPTTRTRHEAEVLAFHESIPGHHLQIAIAQEQSDVPLFRRHMMTTAFVEGWALYSEQLSDEMGLYSSDTDRFGMYSFELWRAARLVVDTGIHAKGWSREQAIEYMVKNTPLARNNIVNEVDRYINTPGQALAYKVGQLEILRLRAEARIELGDAFDLKEFHDVVLGSGAVTLPVLRDQVEAWKGQRRVLIAK